MPKFTIVTDFPSDEDAKSPRHVYAKAIQFESKSLTYANVVEQALEAGKLAPSSSTKVVVTEEGVKDSWVGYIEVAPPTTPQYKVSGGSLT